jgi:hypothetical protein
MKDVERCHFDGMYWTIPTHAIEVAALEHYNK